jgi:hypothetical protein
MIDFLAQATGEGLEFEDAAILHNIKADLPPETINESEAADAKT